MSRSVCCGVPPRQSGTHGIAAWWRDCRHPGWTNGRCVKCGGDREWLRRQKKRPTASGDTQ